MSKLFSPVTIRTLEGDGLTLRNRSVLAPMCTYSVTAKDGVPSDWHLVHLGARANGGFGLIIAEATGVSPEARISDQDLGLWNNEQRDAFKRITNYLHSYGAAAGIQLAHAGGKASTYPHLLEYVDSDRKGSIPEEQGGWETVGPSETDIHRLRSPREMTAEDIQKVIKDFTDAARRADEAGFDFIQIHAAHGYLIHQFLSPLTNKREDEWGGSFENRTRLALEVVKAVREVWPQNKALGIRFSGTDWVEEGWTIEETIQLSHLVTDLGVTAIDLSSAGIGQYFGPMGPGYQTQLAAQVKKSFEGQDMFVTAVGFITTAEQAETLLMTDQADGISIARAALNDPHWAANAAKTLGVTAKENPRAAQYWRGSW
ncbi:NADH:flavin oxidoreductase/NADH oxidase [Neomicrococcus lactis]|uniref:NADH:flavin oxidoreductase/NADH oxidase n=1 Tax=Neomicrococcus lactis TaxID=732241 RepID=UPI002301E191|nr:NADH:flavin oxidoreductase/NADH oxidase [Neomicrococcus lactis]